MLAPAAERGELRCDVELDLIARALAVILGVGLRDIVLHRLGVDLYTLFSQPEAAAALDDTAVANVVVDDSTVVRFEVANGSRNASLAGHAQRRFAGRVRGG